jgi:hypothetical protein
LAFAQLSVTATDPLMHASNQAPNRSITVDFDRAVDPASLSHLRVYGSTGGPIAGALTLENGGLRVRFDPLRAFAAGEVVHVSLSEQLQAADGSFLRTQGYVWSFRVVAAAAPMTFTSLMTWDADPSTFARIYGAQTCDFDGDDYADIALICENTSDVRMYLGTPNASGTFGAMLGTPNVTGSTPSPNENADLDHDGDIDIVTCDTVGNSFTVLLGNGDGTFQPSVSYPMGAGPHGIALLDVDGDGDTDVATANVGTDDVALRRNNGDGTFGAATFFNGGVNGEWGLYAADMNNDAITDLVVGGRFGNEVRVHLSNGDGTFVPQAPRSTGGQTWMIVCGDVNGDRNIDVTTANGPSSNAAVLLGLGTGALQAAVNTAGAGWMVATDLGDLDGDGDLDWVLSSFGGGRWTLHRNNGAGVFTLHHTFFATSNPACAAVLDIDRDRDLDLALMDEIGDTCTIMENGVLSATTLCFGDGSAAACPCANTGRPGHGCDNSFATGGALLNARGVARVSADSLVLSCSGMQPSTSALFFQSAAALGGGMGAPFDDGLKCLASPTLRLGLESSSNGFAERGAPLGDPALSIAGQVPPAGAVVLYQVWYRNPTAFCTSATANLSNAVGVTWMP